MQYVVPILLTLVLTACGGGGGSSTSVSPSVAQSPLKVVVNYTNTTTSFNSAVGDLNGDGLEDVVISSWSNNMNGVVPSRIFVFIQNADGTMNDHTQTYLGTITTNGSQHVFIADFDNDGHNDILVPGFNDGTQGELPVTGVLFWNSPGQQFVAQTLPATMAHGACVGDLNGDGKIDYMAAGFVTGGAFVNNGNRTFTPNTALLDGNTDFSACAIIPNHDGTVSVAYGNHNINGYSGDNIVTSDVNFNLVSVANIAKYTNGDLIDLVAADFNLDGNMDFVAIYNGFLPSPAQRNVFLSSGTDTFAFSQTLDTLGNDYCAYTTTVNGQPAVYFAGNALGDRIYTITNTGVTVYNASAFTDMANLEPNSSQAQAGVPYHGTGGKLYMLQYLNLSTFYTEAM